MTKKEFKAILNEDERRLVVDFFGREIETRDYHQGWAKGDEDGLHRVDALRVYNKLAKI